MLLNSRITFLVIAVIGALAFWQVPHAAAEGGNERMNVELFYGYKYGEKAKVNTTTVYTHHHEWLPALQDARLIVSNGYVRLKLLKGEKLVSAFADYGTIATPTFRNIPWDGKHTVPLHKLLVAKDGMVYDIALTNVSVLVYNPQRPLPQGGNK
jgi:hypothetical protein